MINNLIYIIIHSFMIHYDDDDLKTLLKACIELKGQEYTRAAQHILNEENASDFLNSIIDDIGAGKMEKRIAKILITRKEDVEVFNELRDFIDELRKNPEFGENGRPGTVEGRMVKFTRKGPEQRHVKVFDRYEFVEGLGNIPKYKDILKYTEEEVREGIERNADARQAVFEYFLKYCYGECDHVKIEVLRAIYRYWGKNSLPREKSEPTIDDFLYDIIEDDAYSGMVKYTAATFLNSVDDRIVNALIIIVKDSKYIDYKNDYKATRNCLSYLLHCYERSKDKRIILKLKNVHTTCDWKQELINEYIEEMLYGKKQ